MKSLSAEDIDRLLSFRPPDALLKRLEEVVRASLSEFFIGIGTQDFVNIGILRTDSTALVIRRDTLLALLRAAVTNNPAAFRRAGYESGVLYGIGLIRWLLARSKEEWGEEKLPTDSLDLIRTCLRIDKCSGWFETTLTKTSFTKSNLEWDASLSVRDDFLAAAADVRAKAENLNNWESYRSFWQGYFTATFSTALLAWFGLSVAGREVPLFSAICSNLVPGVNGEMVFDVRARYPRYETSFMNLQREILCPFATENMSRMLLKARSVLEAFVHELAGTPTSNPLPGRAARALKWLVANVPDAGRDSALVLQVVRKRLHDPVHNVAETSKEEAREIVRDTVASILMASEDIRLDSESRAEFSKHLLDAQLVS